MSELEARLRQRLEELRAEYEKGKKTVEELEGQAANVRATLLRISGAIQVLQEALDAGEGPKEPLPPP
jgi:prefoldin subunit 5